ncbi:hypothetical protein M0R45_030231 [Rubus argutus]|uniref:FBD domain-containing protein n=1 Tax=Rubus argutus TaxID=59490 RepID=A0AAW1WB93_RUBAR
MNFSEEKLMDFITAEYPFDFNIHDNKLDLGELSVDLRLYGRPLTWLTITMPYQCHMIPSSVGCVEIYDADSEQKSDIPIFSCIAVGESLVIDMLKPIDSPFHVYLDLAKTMKKLTICNDLEDVEVPGLNGKTAYKSADFSICDDKVIFVDHTGLEEINISDASVLDYKFDGYISRIEKAFVGIGRAYMHYLDGTDVACARALNLITELKSVRHLTLNMNTVGTISCCLLTKESNLPNFTNLVRLEMEVHECFGWKMLFSFLERSPVLQNVIIRKVLDDLENFEYKGPEHGLFTTLNLPQNVPTCLLTSIQNVELTVPEFDERDIPVYQYLLENGAALTNVLVFTTSKSLVQKKISGFKIREDCEIEYKDIP